MQKQQNSLVFFLLFCCLLGSATPVLAQNDALFNAQTSTTAEYGYPNLQITYLFQDSQHVHIRFEAISQLAVGLQFAWQARIVTQGVAAPHHLQKLGGIAQLDTDTTVLYSSTLSFDQAKDLDIYLYLLDREYVVSQASWTLSEALARHENRPQPVVPQSRKLLLAPDGFDLGGLVFNQTRTRFGKEFFNLFQQNWKPPTETEGYWITIKEYPTPGRFTVLSVSLNNKELFQRFLQPRPEYIRSLVIDTIDLLQSILSQGEVDGLFSDQDLHGVGVEEN